MAFAFQDSLFMWNKSCMLCTHQQWIILAISFTDSVHVFWDFKKEHQAFVSQTQSHLNLYIFRLSITFSSRVYFHSEKARTQINTTQRRFFSLVNCVSVKDSAFSYSIDTKLAKILKQIFIVNNVSIVCRCLVNHTVNPVQIGQKNSFKWVFC